MSVELASGHISLSVQYGSAMRRITDDFDRTSRQASRSGAQAGSNYSRGLSRELTAGGERVGRTVGTVIGKGLGAGIKLATAGAALAIAGLGVSLTKGFTRLKNIDSARFKLIALGNSAEEVDKIMKSALDSVKGTAFGMDEAATTAATAVAAGIQSGQSLTDYLTNVADAAAIAGTSLGDMGSIFNKVQTNGKAMTDDLQMLSDRGIPVFTWLQKQYGVTADQLQKMVEDGKVSAADFQRAVHDNIAGSAQKMGQSFEGAVSNMNAAIGRFGASLINSALGGNGLAGPTAGINSLTGALDKLDAAVKEHQGDITGFFGETIDAATGATRMILNFAAETVGAIAVIWNAVMDTFGAMAKAGSEVARILGNDEMADDWAKWSEELFGSADHLYEVKEGLKEAAANVDDFGNRARASMDAAAEKAKSYQAVVDDVGASIAILPGSKEIRLVDNSEEVLKKIDQTKYRLEHLPDGTVKIIPLTEEAQKKVDDFLKSNNPTAPLTVPVILDVKRVGEQLTKVQKDLLNGVGLLPSDGSRSGPGSWWVPSDGSRGQIGGAAPIGGGPGGADVTNSFGPPGGGGRGLVTGAGAEAWRPLVSQIVASRGLSAAWVDPLLRQIQTESGGNPRSVNPTDSNGRGGTQRVEGLFNFLPSTFTGHGGTNIWDPADQINTAISYVLSRYGQSNNGVPNWIGVPGRGFAFGGAARGPGGPRGDKIPAMLSDNEHVFTSDDVNAMGGQGNVYAFRNALHRSGGGSIQWMDFIRGQVPNLPGPGGKLGQQAGNLPNRSPGAGYPGTIGLPDWGIPGTRFGPPPDDWWLKPINPDDLLFPDWLPPDQKNEWRERQKRKRIHGFAGGGEVDQQALLQQLLGFDPTDPNTIQHGQAMGAMPGPNADQLQQMGQGQDALGQQMPGSRTEGYIPAAAGSTSTAGTSFLSGLYGMGAEVIKGVIDQAASAASTAAGLAIAGGTMGIGAAGGSQAGAAAAQAAIGIATGAAKRGVDYGAQMLGIGTDALIEQLTPFGAPRWLSTDPTSFMPQQAIMSAATTSIEKAFQQGQPSAQAAPGIGAAAKSTGVFTPTPSAPAPLPGPEQAPPQLANTVQQDPQPQPTNLLDPLLRPPGFALGGRVGVFDQGGWLQPGGIAINKTKRVEPMAVFNGAQWDNLNAIANQPAPQLDPRAIGGGDDFRIILENVTVGNPDELRRKLDDFQQLRTMRYRGRPSMGGK